MKEFPKQFFINILCRCGLYNFNVLANGFFYLAYIFFFVAMVKSQDNRNKSILSNYR